MPSYRSVEIRVYRSNKVIRRCRLPDTRRKSDIASGGILHGRSLRCRFSRGEGRRERKRQSFGCRPEHEILGELKRNAKLPGVAVRPTVGDRVLRGIREGERALLT